MFVKSWENCLNHIYINQFNRKVCIEHPLINPPYYETKNLALKQKDEKIQVLYAGMLMNNYVDAKYFIRCIRHFSSITNIEFIFFAQGNAVNDLNEKELPFVNKGWIAHDKLVVHMSEASILLSISEKSGIQISSKIFEYMSIGKPIIHVYYVDNDANLTYLNNYPLCLCIKADDKCIQHNAFKLESWIRDNYQKHIEYAEVERIFRELTPEFICDQLMNLCQNLFPGWKRQEKFRDKKIT